MRQSVRFTAIALISLSSSALLPGAFAQQASGGNGGGTLRSWCEQQGNRAMCEQAKTDREAQKSACQGQSQGGQACQQARAKLKSDLQAMHQAGAPESRRGRRGGGADESGAE